LHVVQSAGDSELTEHDQPIRAHCAVPSSRVQSRSSPANYQPRVPSSCQIRPIDARCDAVIRLRFRLSRSAVCQQWPLAAMAYMTKSAAAHTERNSASRSVEAGRQTVSGVSSVILWIARSAFRLLHKTWNNAALSSKASCR